MDLNTNLKKIIYVIILLSCSFLGLKINADEGKSKKIEWEIIRLNNRKELKELIKWKTIDENEYSNKKNNNKKIRKTTKEIDSNNSLLQLGKSVPTAYTLPKGELILETSHVSSFNGGMAGGIGNQNYSGMIQYGLKDYINISSFYTESDDPLYKRIDLFKVQPENLWSNYGISLKWQLIKNYYYNVAFNSSIERWRVGSGGCYGYNCSNSSHNIFNKNNSKVVNDNIVGSVSFPITWKNIKNLDYTISPKFVFLPDSQCNDDGCGEYYGNNFGIGFGISYKINSKIKNYISSYIPINSNNSFNQNLKYNSKNIYTYGINYNVDPNIILEGYITNSFGQTPATSILTMPSSNEIIYGGRFVYRKNSELDKKNKNIKRSNEERVRNRENINAAETIGVGNKTIKTGYSNNSSYFITAKTGLSENFDFEISSELIDEENRSSSIYVKNYIAPGSYNIRGGGKVKFYSEKRGDAITNALRLTYGRVMAENRNGYLFAEIINSKKLNKGLSININKKFAITGNDSLTALAASINYKINNSLYLIPEINLGLKNTQTTFNFALRKYITNQLNIDSYLRNSIGNYDMSSLIRSKKINYGINIGHSF